MFRMIHLLFHYRWKLFGNQLKLFKKPTHMKHWGMKPNGSVPLNKVLDIVLDNSHIDRNDIT